VSFALCGTLTLATVRKNATANRTAAADATFAAAVVEVFGVALTDAVEVAMRGLLAG
jgi:hypothetical protein